MVVGEPNVNNIMSGIENTGGVKQHNHKKKLKQRFDLIRKLGQGTFGKVQLGINKETGQEVAIKTIKKSKIESEADLVRIRREIQIMSSVQHPNIIHIYEVFENKEKMVLVMEYAAGGELYDYLSERKVLDEEEARRIFRQIATACYYCHKHKICHRDLKLENILLDINNNAKIADFGLSNVFDDQRLLNTFCGSPLYASPEIVKGTPYNGPEVDCWSLGVLLYTLVYGAMPFDGSNFKRLVKQISQGDYFEPAKPSPASPLIREMLTVNPKNRANIEKICTHWWVNENYDVNCLEISEELANQTPVRLDLLLSLAPPPPQLESDKLLVTGDVADELKTENASSPPTRSQSAGSLMELSHPAERRIQELLNEDKTAKRKLESTVSTDRMKEGLKRKDKIIKENTVADITVHGAIEEAQQEDDASMSETVPLDRSLTQTISKEMDVETEDPSLQGAACAEIIEESKKIENKKPKVKRTLSTSVSTKVLEGINEIPSQENLSNNLDKENIVVQDVAQPSVEKPEPKTAAKKKVKKKILGDKNEEEKKPEEQKPEEKEEKVEEPTKPIERRRSRIFEAAEKFQNMITPPSETKTPIVEKPKKIVIPGVSVDGFKKEFERKASLTSTSPPKLLNKTISKKVLIDQPSKDDEEKKEKPEVVKEPTPATKPVIEDDRKERVRNAVSIISSALDKEGARKSKSRPCCIRKPPVPFGASGRSASGNIGLLTASPLSPPLGPKPFVRPNFDTKSEVKKVEEKPEPEIEENKTSNAEITLKSATLPRRKTTKAEIQLNYPVPKPAQMEFKTEMAHNVQAAPAKSTTQRSEVVVPVNFRASSLEPGDGKAKERIIPIAFEQSESGQPPAKPPSMPRTFSTTNKMGNQQRSGSLSRQSTQDSDTENVGGEPIKKSPREYIIPIAVEGGGYVTPRAGSLEPSDTASTTSTMTNRSRNKFGKARRMNSLLSDRDSEDDTSTSLNRHSSFGKESDTEDGRKDIFRLHRLRSTRPKRTMLEPSDSLSSGEEDDDDGFEILTAEHLFSNLLSRVRDLTQKLNVEDGGRPGFPSSRLLSHFDHGTNFWNFHNRLDPITRSVGRSMSRERDRNNSHRSTPWKRSVSRDLATDIESVFRDPTSPTRPRGDKKSKKENLNLADLDLKKFKLSDEDALALSYLTPGLSRRIQKQLFSQLAPSDMKKLQRTLSQCDQNPYDIEQQQQQQHLKMSRRSVDRVSSTLPLRYSVEREKEDTIPETIAAKSYRSRLPSSSASKVSESEFLRPKPSRSISLREPRNYTKEKSPESTSYSESFSTDSSSRISNKLINKTELKKPSSSPRRISRFLRPDFFDPPKEDNVLMKEKKERELETQKVLKEIRDKRKLRLNSRRERSLSREKSNDLDSNKFMESKEDIVKETDLLLNNVSNNIKNLENNVKTIHDYVNVPKETENSKIPDYVNVKVEEEQPLAVVKKTRISKLVRPKSYPTETPVLDVKPESEVKESKISRFRKGFTRQSSKEKDKTKEDKNETNKNINEEEKGHKNKLLQSIEKKLEKFRSTSSKDPEEIKALKEKKSSVDNAIKRLREQSLPRNLEHCTESGLIKRAVSVEDLTTNNKPLQASRKSVTKILGLFKKYEEQDQKKLEKVEKKKKTPEKITNDTENKKIVERPKSLLLDKMKTFQTNGVTKSDEKKSKLPVNTTYRRSLNLDKNDNSDSIIKTDKNLNTIECKTTKSDKICDNDNNHIRLKPERTNLKLDLSRIPGTSDENRNSVTTTDDSSAFLSPDDNDTWSVCSDYHTNDLISPVSPNGHHHICSGDENESVIDRIRRKSFYTRFNENKRPVRRTNRDLLKDYGSLDRRSYDYKTPLTRRTSYGSNLVEAPTKRDYMKYTRSSSLMNDYVNVPNRYQTYSSSKIARPTTTTSLGTFSDSEDNNSTLDELLTAAKARKYTSPLQTSVLNSRTSSISPVNEYYRPPSSLINTPTSSEPV